MNGENPSSAGRRLPGTIVVLGVVSFLTDISSEMVYPLLPLFLTATLKAGPAFLGLIEGLAEATAALLKLYSGILADRVKSRKGLVLAGYTLSAMARPFIALAGSAATVLAIRVADRTGKGIRTAPRDALIADAIDARNRGYAFGFHRAMDHAGALLGPLLASLIIFAFTDDLRVVFLVSAIPGLLAVLLIATRVRDPARRHISPDGRLPLAGLPRGPFRNYLVALLVFTIGNSSDAFLILKASQAGMPPGRIGLLWAFFHLVKTAASVPFGALSDRVGRRGVIVAGWAVYAASYAGFALAASETQIWVLFAFYGLFYGLTEGTEKAFVADLAPVEARGTAFGWFNFTVAVGMLPASLLFGAIWQTVGSVAAFATGAALAGVAAVILLAGARAAPSPAAP